MIDWVRGDMLGLGIPAHRVSLAAGGEAFLTRAFRAAGALSSDNRVTRITRFEECPGGSTGSKLFLSVDYQTPSPQLHSDLFVKFSRDFDNEIRDRARIQMQSEVQFALLSRGPDFPITVPKCYFADYHEASGSGILITRRIPYGIGDTEPQYGKCLDYLMPGALAHYQALISALAQLAGSQKAGRQADLIEKLFPFDPGRLVVSTRSAYTAQQIRNRVARYSDFASAYPQFLPENIRSADFIARLAEQAPRFMELEPKARKILASKPGFIALCHWNANVDNAWYWRNSSGELECGLMDWGHVSQMNIAMALWGCMSAAETDIWNKHLEELLALFATEFQRSGGPAVDPGELKLHILLYAGTMGLNWLLDAPAMILARISGLDQLNGRRDERFRNNETARTQLQFMTVFLNLWETQNMAEVLRCMEET